MTFEEFEDLPGFPCGWPKPEPFRNPDGTRCIVWEVDGPFVMTVEEARGAARRLLEVAKAVELAQGVDRRSRPR